MNFFSDIRREMSEEKRRKKNNKFNKKLYDSDIIQQLIKKANELEERVCELERK